MGLANHQLHLDVKVTVHFFSLHTTKQYDSVDVCERPGASRTYTYLLAINKAIDRSSRC